MHGGKGRSDTRGERELCSQAQAVIPLPSEGGCVEAFKVVLGTALHIPGGEQKGTGNERRRAEPYKCRDATHSKRLLR